MAIVSFRDERVRELLARFVPVRGLPPQLARVAQRKLRQLDEAGDLGELREPPGNRLEALVRDRAGQHSIRINQKYRICFRWTARGPAEVEIVDYH